MTPADPIRVLVADDEPLARAGLVGLLAGDPDVELAGQCGDGGAAVEAIRVLDPDLVLLDVQMPVLDGFGVLRAIGPDRMPPVVFVTAFDEFAVRAFEVHAVDYLLKPFTDARFQEALDRVKGEIRRGRVADLSRRLVGLLEGDATAPPPPGGPGGFLSRLLVKKGSAMHFVPVEDIDWIEAADYCVRVHAAGKLHVLRESMSSLEQRLDPRRFHRVHRSTIVNLDRIREVQPFFQGDHVLLLRDGTRLKLSRGRRGGLEEAMEGG